MPTHNRYSIIQYMIAPSDPGGLNQPDIDRNKQPFPNGSVNF